LTSDDLVQLFGTARPIIGMAHFPPLPRTPLYDRDRGVEGLVAVIQRDVGALVEAGFDAILFCNEGDRPYALEAPREAVAAMSAVIARSAPKDIPFGVDYLWDPMGALAIAHATGASFVREVFTGAYESDMGLWSTDPAAALRYRAELGAERVRLFMNVTPEFASPLGDRPVGVRARSAVVNSLADAILISGAMAGAEADRSALEEAKAALDGSAPVFVNTGVTAATVGALLARFDGIIVGTALKVGGVTWNPVDPERAKNFMGAAVAARREALGAD
jgi:membrane complex biogenesis BtpA family protein